jgi:hypothetical protein
VARDLLGDKRLLPKCLRTLCRAEVEAVTAGKCQLRIKKCETSGVGLWRRAGEGHFWEAGSLTAAILKSEIGSHPEHRAAPIAGCREGRQSPSEPYLPCPRQIDIFVRLASY